MIRSWSTPPCTTWIALALIDPARAILKPGDIYWVEIHPAETRGSEQFKTRPFVIVSKFGINRVLKTVVGVPLSLGAMAKDSTGWRIFIPKEEIIGSREALDCIAKCDAI